MLKYDQERKKQGKDLAFPKERRESNGTGFGVTGTSVTVFIRRSVRPMMICSTLGLMAFAQEQRIINCHECPVSSCGETRCVNGEKYTELDQIVECPTHGLHDAERYYIHFDHMCAACGVEKEKHVFDHFEYVCLN